MFRDPVTGVPILGLPHMAGNIVRKVVHRFGIPGSRPNSAA
jgi:hypothetical protein